MRLTYVEQRAHILVHFLTVAEARAARKSAFYAIGFIGCSDTLTFIIAFCAIIKEKRCPPWNPS